MTACQLCRAKLSVFLHCSSNTERACVFALLFFTNVKILCESFYLFQVEEEASDKDNKNCTNNGKQLLIILSERNGALV